MCQNVKQYGNNYTTEYALFVPKIEYVSIYLQVQYAANKPGPNDSEDIPLFLAFARAF